jgi:hypothetical protein
VDQWIAALDDLLSRPFGTDDDGGPEPHHVDLRESQDFWDDQTRDEVFKPILAEFEADRARLARELTSRYGAPQRKDLRPYFDETPPVEPDSALCAYLTGWFLEVDVWRAGSRGIVAEVGHYDKELSLQLMLVVGELESHRPGTGR